MSQIRERFRQVVEAIHVGIEIQSGISGGVRGDIVAYSMTLDVLRSILQVIPDLKTMDQISPIAFFYQAAL